MVRQLGKRIWTHRVKAKLASCPTIAIRADGSRSVGMGHVMRTLSIAEALRVAGAHVLYVCADKQPKEIIESRGFEVLVLETDPANLMGEFQRLSLVLRDIDAQFVFVDSFDAAYSYFESVRALCPVGSFAFGRKFTRGLDLVVSYLPSSDEQWLKDRFGRDGIALLFGARYVPARREFLDMNKRSFANYVKSVLIVAGGSDQLGMCARILEKLQGDSFWSAIEKHVVVGPTSGCRNKVLSLAEDDASVFVHESVRDMASLMSECDIAITACGHSVYELALCRVPMVAYATSADQAENGFVPGIMEFIGDIRSDLDAGTDKICASAHSLVVDASRRAAQISAASTLGVDGRGAERIAKQILDIAQRGPK